MGASMSPEQIADETETKILVCTCSCGCQKETGIPDLNIPALTRHTRCSECSHPEHTAQYPEAVESSKANEGMRGTRPITELYELTEEEKEKAQAARLESMRDIWRSQWRKWQESLPEKFRDAETEHPQVLERLKRIKDGKSGVASLAIVGSVGRGKTWLAIAFANQAIRAGYFKPSEVLFGSEADLLAAAANSSYSDVESALRRLVSGRYRMIIIDDVGRGTWLRDDMRAKVFSLVMDKFWADNRVVVVTSNLTRDGLAEYVGEGAMDRLRSMTGYGGIVLDTEHMRRKITEEMLKKGGE